MEKVKFNKRIVAGFRTTLTERIDDYFSRNQLSKKGDWRLYSKSIILFGVFAGCYIGVLTNPPLAVMLAFYMILGLTIAGLGFNVMHDASHKSYSNNPTLNAWMAFLGGDLMGGSTFIWNIKHNMLHHTYTNIEGHDDDIAKYPMFRLNTHQKKLWFHKYQWLYAPVLYSVLSMHWSLVNDFSRLKSGKVLIKDLEIKGTDLLLFVLGKVLNVALLIVIPLLVLPVWWHALLGFVVMHLTTGITLAFVFQMAHVVEDTAFPAPPTMDEWMIHQLDTTANFAPNNKLLSWYVGGLNYQVEHHLFSNISHVHYPEISKIVQQTCKEYGINYHVFPTFRKALRSHFAYLRQMGQVA